MPGSLPPCVCTCVQIPVVQVSLQAQMDPLHHMRVGQALAPLRDQGVLIVGSGMSFHNMQVLLGGGFGNRPGAAYGPNEVRRGGAGRHLQPAAATATSATAPLHVRAL